METNELDEKAKGLVKQLLITESELLSVLMEMKRLHSFAVLNYDGIFDYCERGLLLSRSQSYYFQKVAEKSEEIPELKTALSQGEHAEALARLSPYY